MVLWYILWSFGIFLWSFGIFYGPWYILWSFGIFFPVFGILYQEKSGNPDVELGKKILLTFLNEKNFFCGAAAHFSIQPWLSLRIKVCGVSEICRHPLSMTATVISNLMT
jgi:hypothetical protein